MSGNLVMGENLFTMSTTVSHFYTCPPAVVFYVVLMLPESCAPNDLRVYVYIYMSRIKLKHTFSHRDAAKTHAHTLALSPLT